jgi:general secretion pathway protein E
MQVQQQLDLGFAEGVRTLLRQDPDIIMIGEIRDLQTAQMAIQASLTGHLVLSTLHTNDSPSAISRLLDLGAPHYLIQSTLAGVMAQRLVRTLCAHCKTPDAPIEESEWQLLTRPWVAEAPKHACAPNGCLECRKTGFLGRTGIYEMFKVSPDIRKLIKAETSVPELTEAAVREGMRPLRISAAAQVARGVTTMDEVWKVLPPPEA